MSAIRWCSVVVLACGALAACDAIFGKELNPKYCAAHPDDTDCRGDASQSCSSTAQCTAPQVCDVGGTNMCVECTQQEAAACTGATPVCGDDRMCRRCAAHPECAGSNVCLPDGTCADPAQVAYVQAGGTGPQPCTKGAPCGTLQEGVTAVNASRPYIKVVGSGTVADGVATTIDGKAVTIVADPGAKLDRMGDGPILVVRSNNANVSIYDLEITGQTGLADSAIQLEPNGGTPMLSLVRVKVTGSQGRGISVTGGMLTATQSTVSTNQGGGISISGAGVTFNITNSFILRNGDELAGTFGGLSLGIAAPGSNRLEFNTIVDNKAAVNSAGVVCNVPAFMAPNNIVARNNLAGSTTAPGAQITMGGCTYPSSRIQNDVNGLMFEHPDPPGVLSYKLLLGSAAIDQAASPSDIVVDFEGQPRPSGPGKDIGADELQQ
jgi:hypothetical protein